MVRLRPRATDASQKRQKRDKERQREYIVKKQRLIPATAERVQQMETAIELEVDKSDFGFTSVAEQAIWDELEQEFHQRRTKIGLVWIAA